MALPIPPPVAAPVSARSPRRVGLGLAIAAALTIAISGRCGLGGEVQDDYETAATTWTTAASVGRMIAHERSATAPHRGRSCERLTIDAAPGQPLRIETPIGPAAVIDELQASVWVRASRPDLRLAVRVQLPGWISTRTGRPVEALVPGGTSTDIDRWQLLAVDGIPQALARQLPALRLEHGPGKPDAARATHLVLDAPPLPGRMEIAVDDLHLSGVLPPPQLTAAAAAIVDPLVIPAAVAAPVEVDPPAGLSRGVLDVDGLPFFPRSIDWSGEPLAMLAALGFNCVRFAEPASAEQLVEARRAGVWVICPPPPIPDIDVRDPESLPMLRNWDRVLMWDLGTGLSETDLELLAEQGRRVRACDPRAGRPLIGSADSGLRSVSRHLDMLVARKTVHEPRTGRLSQVAAGAASACPAGHAAAGDDLDRNRSAGRQPGRRHRRHRRAGAGR